MRFVADEHLDLLPPSAVPFIGRAKERAVLTKALSETSAARGQTWLVEGPAGIGKSRLARWLEDEAVKSGFHVLWGYCLKESNMPFFPFHQIFRRSNPNVAPLDLSSSNSSAHILPLLSIFEDERPLRVLERVAALSSSHPCLVLSRDRPSNLRKQLPSLATDARILQLTKSAEGEDFLAPGQVDAIGERLSQHLRSSQGAVVALTSIDYLISQNGFKPVLRLVQFLREEAEQAEAHVLLSMNPATLEKRELALMEGEGEVVREATREESAPSSSASSEPDLPAMTMIQYLEVLEKDAPQHPSLLVVDDVQWADPDSLRTLQFLARNIRGLPVLLVCTLRVEEWRTPEEKVEQGLDEILGKMDEEGVLCRLPLLGLGEDESKDLAERAIGMSLRKGESVKGDAIQIIVHRAEGNPYFVLETVRQLVREGLLHREGDHAVLVLSSIEAGGSASDALPIPPTLRRLVARQLSTLCPEEMDLLRWASEVGSEFDSAPLAGVLHRPELEVSTILSRLERDIHVLAAQPGEERWSFAHPLLWEVTLAETKHEERRRKALALADWWAEHRAENVEVVTRLYHDALETGRGLPWVRRAVDMSISAHAPETVERYHRWMQDLFHMAGTDPGSRVREGMSVCERHLLEIGGGPALTHMLESILLLPATPDQHLPAQILLAYSLCGVDAREARAHMDVVNNEIRSGHAQLPLKWEMVGSLVNAYLLISQAKYRAAIEELQRMSKAAGEVQEPWISGRVAFLRGFCYAYEGQFAEAKDALNELHKLIQAHGPSLIEGWYYSLDAEIASMEGDFGRAEESEGLAISSHRRRGDMHSVCVSIGNVGMIAAMRGEFDAATTYLSEGQMICGRFSMRDIASYLLMLEYHILWSEHRWSELVGKFREAPSGPVEDEEGRALAYSFLAEAHLELGDLPSASTSLAKADQRKDELSTGDYANAIRVRARVEEAKGDHGLAKQTLVKALDLLEEHPNMYWRACVKAEIARWESRHGDSELAASYRAEAESLFERSGILPAGRPKWLQDIVSKDAYANRVSGLPASAQSSGLSPKARIAILPLVNISPDPKDEYIADGLTEELITVLSQLRELRVIARTSVSQYKSSTKTVLQIGNELGVETVLEGSVRKAGDRLRITLQLINTRTQEHEWAQTYDRKLDDVFEIQTDIAQQVAKQLKVNVGAVEATRLKGRPAPRPDSYLAYLKGRTLLHNYSKESLEFAKKQFELAISLDPNSAAAHSGLADVARTMGWWFPDPARTRADVAGRSAAARAIELDPDLAEAHASLGIILWDDFDYAGAEKEFRLALSLNPSYSLAHNWYGAVLADEGRGDEALQEFALANAADPLWHFNLLQLIQVLVWQGKLEEALAKIHHLGEFHPDTAGYHFALARYRLARSDLDECLREFDRYLELEPEPRAKAITQAYRIALSGEKEKARVLLQQEEAQTQTPPNIMSMAYAYAEIGDLDACFRLLDRMVTEHVIALQQWRLDPRLQNVRNDPRFQALLKRMNLT